MKHIVKRQGHTEAYEPKKLYASIYASCLSVGTSVGEAELISDRVCQDVEKSLDHKHEVTAHDIREMAYKHFQVYHPDAAYMYYKHRELAH